MGRLDGGVSLHSHSQLGCEKAMEGELSQLPVSFLFSQGLSPWSGAACSNMGLPMSMSPVSDNLSEAFTEGSVLGGS